MRGRYICHSSFINVLFLLKRLSPKGLDWLMKKADAFYHIALYDLDHLLLV